MSGETASFKIQIYDDFAGLRPDQLVPHVPVVPDVHKLLNMTIPDLPTSTGTFFLKAVHGSLAWSTS